jgi:branched-subunit amino acid transport protein AzlD
MTGLARAALYTLAAGCAVFLCRALPFLIIPPQKDAGKDENARPRAPKGFLGLIERIVPPVAMTVLACNSIAAPVKEDPRTAVPVLCGAALSLLAQLWKGNFLLSILGGTALYMLLARLA